MNAVISTNERHWIITDHVIFKLRYNQIYPLKMTILPLQLSLESAKQFLTNPPSISSYLSLNALVKMTKLKSFEIFSTRISSK